MCIAIPIVLGGGQISAGAAALYGLGAAAVAGAGAYTGHWLSKQGLNIFRSEESPHRTVDEPGSLEGATPDEVEGAIPSGWVETPSRKGGGTRYTDPKTKGADQVRVMPGNPADPTLVKQGPYVRVTRGGKPSDPIPLRGNPALNK
jgi:hypothetical protein